MPSTKPAKIQPAALKAMEAYRWPGNIRELRNFVYRSFILADDVLDGNHPPEREGAAVGDSAGLRD